VLFAAVFLACVVVDRTLKDWVTTHMKLGEAIPSKDAFFKLLYTTNDGVSFSMFSGGDAMLLVVLQSVLFTVCTVALIYALNKGVHGALLTALTWISAGGLGNLSDRIRFGYVIDFISVGDFPIWNFADMCIVGGCILIGLWVILVHGRHSEIEESISGADSFDEDVDSASNDSTVVLDSHKAAEDECLDDDGR